MLLLAPALEGMSRGLSSHRTHHIPCPAVLAEVWLQAPAPPWSSGWLRELCQPQPGQAHMPGGGPGQQGCGQGWIPTFISKQSQEEALGSPWSWVPGVAQNRSPHTISCVVSPRSFFSTNF